MFSLGNAPIRKGEDKKWVLVPGQKAAPREKPAWRIITSADWSAQPGAGVFSLVDTKPLCRAWRPWLLLLEPDSLSPGVEAEWGWDPSSSQGATELEGAFPWEQPWVTLLAKRAAAV